MTVINTSVYGAREPQSGFPDGAGRGAGRGGRPLRSNHSPRIGPHLPSCRSQARLGYIGSSPRCESMHRGSSNLRFSFPLAKKTASTKRVYIASEGAGLNNICPKKVLKVFKYVCPLFPIMPFHELGVQTYLMLLSARETSLSLLCSEFPSAYETILSQPFSDLPHHTL